MLTTLVKTISRKIRLQSIEKEAEDTYTFKFEVPEKVQWTPGAYAHFLSNDLSNGEKVVKKEVHEFSIMSHPDEKLLSFTTRIRENPSNFKLQLLRLKPGDKIRMFKIGNHLKDKVSEKPLVYISMGVGLAKFRPLIIDKLKNKSQQMRNINVDRSGEYIYANELEKLAGENLENHWVNNRAALFQEIDKCLERTDSTYYIVGSKDFNTSIGDYLKDKDVAESDIFFDKH